METKKGNEPAFPSEYSGTETDEFGMPIIVHRKCYGMNKRIYAAIELRVPDSGEEWLDEMIRKANRLDTAKAVMQGLLSNSNNNRTSFPKIAQDSLIMTDELLKQEAK